MKSEVTLNYDVKIYPYVFDPSESVAFSLRPEKLSQDTAKFELFNGKEWGSMYFGFADDGIWFLDPDANVGTFICNTASVEGIAEDLEEINEYDTEDCYTIAKSIELISKDFFNRNVRNTKDDTLPF